MDRTTKFHRYHKCPTCETYWRETGRQIVGDADSRHSVTCPSCQGS